MIDKSPGTARHAALPAPALLSHQLTQIKIVPGSVTAQPGRAAGSPVASDELCKPLLTGVLCGVYTCTGPTPPARALHRRAARPGRGRLPSVSRVSERLSSVSGAAGPAYRDSVTLLKSCNIHK